MLIASLSTVIAPMLLGDPETAEKPLVFLAYLGIGVGPLACFFAMVRAREVFKDPKVSGLKTAVLLVLGWMLLVIIAGWSVQ
jgi:hypothetical protein